jgi:hypothetical protein
MRSFLCVYTQFVYQMAFEYFSSPIANSPLATPYGVIAYFKSLATAGNILGSWAYTAP